MPCPATHSVHTGTYNYLPEHPWSEIAVVPGSRHVGPSIFCSQLQISWKIHTVTSELPWAPLLVVYGIVDLEDVVGAGSDGRPTQTTRTRIRATATVTVTTTMMTTTTTTR